VSEASTPETLIGFGRVLSVSAEIHFELNLLDEAVHAAERALKVHRRLALRRLTVRAALAESLRRVGEIRLARDDPAEAIPAFREAEQILRRVASERPRYPEYKYELSRVLSERARALSGGGQHDEAAAAVEEAFTLASQAAEAPEAPPAWRRQLGFCHEKRGDVLLALAETYAKTEAALDEYRAALAIYEQLSDQGIAPLTGRIDLARVLTSIGEAQLQQDRPDAAREVLDRASEIARQGGDRRPEHSAWKQVLERIRKAKDAPTPTTPASAPGRS
jgi:tetratricopeptide (TPR) repeat protein